MNVNNLQNPYSISGVYTSQTLKSESSSLFANSMPTKNRIVPEPGVTKRPLNNAPPNFIRHVYLNNQSSMDVSHKDQDLFSNKLDIFYLLLF